MRSEEIFAEKRSIELIRKVQSMKKHKLRELEESEDKALAIEDYESELLKAVDKLEDDLMEIEMRLQYALSDALDIYKEKIKKVIDTMKQQTENFISSIESNSLEFNRELAGYAAVESTDYQSKQDEENEAFDDDDDQEQLLEFYAILSDTETLNSTLDQSKDFMSKIIHHYETEINNMIKSSQNETDKKILTDQHSRNRNIIREIILACEKLKEEINQDFNMLRGDEDD
mmetsp:Transcript_12258/g.20626  ORF Transcript_12258/g.20626 Transcript_12258/m.20626 type:complete len:230 (-) Transcript_12258:49-738(-)